MGERHKTRLVQIRRARELTQAQVAGALGVSKATYSSWESGRIELGAERIVALAEQLGCTPNDILGVGTQGPKEPQGLVAVSQEEEYLLSLYRMLPPNIKEDIVDIMQTTARSWRARPGRHAEG